LKKLWRSPSSVSRATGASQISTLEGNSDDKSGGLFLVQNLASWRSLNEPPDACFEVVVSWHLHYLRWHLLNQAWPTWVPEGNLAGFVWVGFGKSGRPLGALSNPKRWGVSSLAFLDGVKAPKGPPRPPQPIQKSPARLLSNMMSETASLGQSGYLKAVWLEFIGSVLGVWAAPWGFKQSKKVGGFAPHFFGWCFSPQGVAQTPTTDPKIPGQIAFRYDVPDS
jgi:hypothetical protein